MGSETICVPDIGSDDPVDVIEITVKPGDVIAAEDTIVVLESDKASVEVPAPGAGKVLKLLVSQGDRVRQGDPLLELESDGAKGTAPSAEGEKSAAARPSGKKAQQKKEPAPEVASSEQSSVTSSSGKEQSIEVVKVPDLGDIESAELIEVNVAVGDKVEAEQAIAVLESDKASMEIPSPLAGEVVELLARVGDKLKGGSPLLRLATTQPAGGRAETPAAPAPVGKAEPRTETKTEQKTEPRQEEVPQTHAVASSGGHVHAGPAVRKLARELGVDLQQVEGHGPKGRILKDDVHAHVKKRLRDKAPATGSGLDLSLPEIDFSRFGGVERVELSRIRKVAAANLHRSWLVIPHVTQHDEADITELESFRQQENKRLQKDGVKLTMLAFMARACAAALQEFPDFNSSLESSGAALIRKHYIHIGVAVDTENGLVVPVLKDVDHKGVVDIAREVAALAAKARERKLVPGDMQGGTFSISSLGGIGGTAFTPIVNWPEVAILGVSKAEWKPRWNGKEFVPRLIVPLSLSYDHRVIDGAEAARFTAFLCATLADVRRALL